MKSRTGFFLALLVFTALPKLHANDKDSAVKTSTAGDAVELSTIPAGSPFMRHLAADYDQDVKLLAKFEKKGFGRAETITLMLIAAKSSRLLKDLGNERLKEKTSLRVLAEQVGLNYDELYSIVYEIKSDIELKGDNNLPPPVFDKKDEPDNGFPKPKPKKKKEKTEDKNTKDKKENDPKPT